MADQSRGRRRFMLRSRSPLNDLLWEWFLQLEMLWKWTSRQSGSFVFFLRFLWHRNTSQSQASKSLSAFIHCPFSLRTNRPSSSELHSHTLLYVFHLFQLLFISISKASALSICILQTLFQWDWSSFHVTLAGAKRRELALQITQDDSSSFGG